MIHLSFVGSAAVPAIICRLDFRRYSLHGTISSLPHVRRASLDPAGLREQKTRTDKKKTPASARLFLGRLHRCHTPPATSREKHYKPSSITTRSKDEKTQVDVQTKKRYCMVALWAFFSRGIDTANVRPAGGRYCIVSSRIHLRTTRTYAHPQSFFAGRVGCNKRHTARWLHTPRNGNARAFYCRCRLCCKGRKE
ncbi:unnamed protein product [Ectocarpus sp. 8 AP-2014]